MNEPCNFKILFVNFFALIMYAALDESHRWMNISLMALVIMIYVLQVLAKIFNQIKRIADYLEKIKENLK